ncbi:hypothetical protein [uncultured Albimonas sp.]|uniref:hypothetical protein n=1 Tax=uncultured Albimonas sp. TaxID=1331701 RepID=UPI0030EB366F|tara:strand:- start:608 stop:1108 length:501 start_codon:yes stop_codon:yes gene_type:complete
MTILLRAATAAVIATTLPVIGGSGVETWTNVGALRGLDVLVALDDAYLDESAGRVLVATRLVGDIDARLETIPDLDDSPPTPRRVGVRAMTLTYIYDCDLGEIEQVRFHSAYDDEDRRMAAPADFVNLVENTLRTGLLASSSTESRAGWRKLCARLRARLPADLRT